MINLTKVDFFTLYKEEKEKGHIMLSESDGVQTLFKGGENVVLTGMAITDNSSNGSQWKLKPLALKENGDEIQLESIFTTKPSSVRKIYGSDKSFIPIPRQIDYMTTLSMELLALSAKGDPSDRLRALFSHRGEIIKARKDETTNLIYWDYVGKLTTPTAPTEQPTQTEATTEETAPTTPAE